MPYCEYIQGLCPDPPCDAAKMKACLKTHDAFSGVGKARQSPVRGRDTATSGLEPQDTAGSKAQRAPRSE